MIRLSNVQKTYPARRGNDAHAALRGIDLDELADMVSTVVEGGIVMSKALGRPQMLANQIMLLRSFVKLLFAKQAG